MDYSSVSDSDSKHINYYFQNYYDDPIPFKILLGNSQFFPKKDLEKFIHLMSNYFLLVIQ